jgi:hypothetical protein
MAFLALFLVLISRDSILRSLEKNLCEINAWVGGNFSVILVICRMSEINWFWGVILEATVASLGKGATIATRAILLLQVFEITYFVASKGGDYLRKRGSFPLSLFFSSLIF